MRAGAATSDSLSEFQKGMVAGAISLTIVVGLVRLAGWAQENVTAGIIAEWIFEPRFAAIDLVPVILIGLVVWTVWILLQA